jgi:hypothetical protein
MHLSHGRRDPGKTENLRLPPGKSLHIRSWALDLYVFVFPPPTLRKSGLLRDSKLIDSSNAINQSPLQATSGPLVLASPKSLQTPFVHCGGFGNLLFGVSNVHTPGKVGMQVVDGALDIDGE